MKNYLYSLANDANKICTLLNSTDTQFKGELAIKAKEYSRLIELLRNALSFYRYFGEEDDEEFVFFSSLVKKNDDRDIEFVLNEQAVIVTSDDEEDYVSSDDEMQHGQEDY